MDDDLFDELVSNTKEAIAMNNARITEFCTWCGAGIGEHRREGEGTCPHCHHKGKDWSPDKECPVCFSPWGACKHTATGELSSPTGV